MNPCDIVMLSGDNFFLLQMLYIFEIYRSPHAFFTAKGAKIHISAYKSQQYFDMRTENVILRLLAVKIDIGRPTFYQTRVTLG